MQPNIHICFARLEKAAVSDCSTESGFPQGLAPLGQLEAAPGKIETQLC